jgi:hypothetical protein
LTNANVSFPPIADITHRLHALNVSNSIVLLSLAVAFGLVLAVGLKKGFMPTYLTGGVFRHDEPLTFWLAASALSVALIACVIVGFVIL